MACYRRAIWWTLTSAARLISSLYYGYTVTSQLIRFIHLIFQSYGDRLNEISFVPYEGRDVIAAVDVINSFFGVPVLEWTAPARTTNSAGN